MSGAFRAQAQHDRGQRCREQGRADPVEPWRGCARHPGRRTGQAGRGSPRRPARAGWPTKMLGQPNSVTSSPPTSGPMPRGERHHGSRTCRRHVRASRAAARGAAAPPSPGTRTAPPAAISTRAAVRAATASATRKPSRAPAATRTWPSASMRAVARGGRRACRRDSAARSPRRDSWRPAPGRRCRRVLAELVRDVRQGDRDHRRVQRHQRGREHSAATSGRCPRPGASATR